MRDPELRWWVLRHGVSETFVMACCAEYGVEPALVLQSLRHARWQILLGRLDSQDALGALAEAFRSFGCYPPPPDYRDHVELRTMVLEAGKVRERQARGENAPHDPNGG
ncbi:hypothetical protein [Deferrisoma palaeochoriense]